MQELTDIQKIKAEEALAKKKKQQSAQAKAYMESLRAIVDMQMGVTGILPYRIVLDLIKKYMRGEYSKYDIPNALYPHDGAKIGYENYTIDNVDEIRKVCEKYGIKDKDTEYYYTHFLQGYNFDDFKPFDFTGGAIKTVNIEQWRNLLKDLQSDFEKNPEKFYVPGKEIEKE